MNGFHLRKLFCKPKQPFICIQGHLPENPDEVVRNSKGKKPCNSRKTISAKKRKLWMNLLFKILQVLL